MFVTVLKPWTLHGKAIAVGSVVDIDKATADNLAGTVRPATDAEVEAATGGGAPQPDPQGGEDA
ncbi:hypothetical protein FHP25_35895 [Vineibacter terrae]|uniref:Uncharacterized protein n=1 Tax=Vineibacter terrae TaxID=2586908 RepID=A0A5C8P8N2_9HYPH|nr:hypothetical protein [Vineibacter terrae]TXL70107.1 hypothetical protein FHP25_35895 [Vineibacter terrae]